MYWNNRPNGISLLLACKNEEAILPLCLKSFIDFADEIIIVDNGSSDGSTEIAHDYSKKYLGQVQLCKAPALADLSEVHQLGLERAKFRWIIRGDADFVAYTDGSLNITSFRQRLLNLPRLPIPQFFGAILPNLMCDFWHTGESRANDIIGVNEPGRYVPPPITGPNPRIYEFFPGFCFQRVGRWEATSYSKLIWFLRRKLDYPLWMHCNIKNDLSYFLRSERTNWREQGDFSRYPTLLSYITDIVETKYDTKDINQAADIYMQTHVYPFLMKYEQDKYFPYPNIVKLQMNSNPIFKLIKKSGAFARDYYG